MIGARRYVLLLACIAPLSVSCAHVEKRVQVEDKYLRTDRRTIESAERVEVVATFVGSETYESAKLQFTARRVETCKEERRVISLRTERTERRLFVGGKAADNTYLGGLLLVGGAGIVTGTALYTAAPYLPDEHQTDPETGERDEVSDRELARGWGGASLCLGVPLLIAGGVESARARDTVRVIGEFPGEAQIAADDRCSEKPVIREAVLLDFGVGAQAIGTTDETGLLTVSISSLGPQAEKGSGPWATIVVDGAQVGTVELPPELSRYFVALADARARRQPESIEQFIAAYPRSTHASEVVALKSESNRAEAESYSNAVTTGTIDALEAFLVAHPGGEHWQVARSELLKVHAAKARTAAASNKEEAALRFYDAAVSYADDDNLIHSERDAFLIKQARAAAGKRQYDRASDLLSRSDRPDVVAERRRVNEQAAAGALARARKARGRKAHEEAIGLYQEAMGLARGSDLARIANDEHGALIDQMAEVRRAADQKRLAKTFGIEITDIEVREQLEDCFYLVMFRAKYANPKRRVTPIYSLVLRDGTGRVISRGVFQPDANESNGPRSLGGYVSEETFQIVTIVDFISLEHVLSPTQVSKKKKPITAEVGVSAIADYLDLP